MKADLFSISIYWGALLISILFCQIYQKQQPKKNRIKIFYIFLICMPLSLVAGARYDVGTDYLVYAEYYLYNKSYDLSYIFENFRLEKGFFIFNKLCYYLSGGSIFFYFFAVEFFILCLAVSGLLRFSKRINLPAAFFLYYIFFYHFSLNGIRSAIAISFLIFSYYYLLEKKWVKYFVVIFIGSLFHSTIFLCMLYPFALLFSGKFAANDYYINNTKRTTVYILFLIIFIYIIGSLLPIITQVFFADMYDMFIESSDGKIGIGTFFLFILYVVPIILFNWKYMKNDKIYARLRDLSLLYLPVSIIGYFAVWASRLNLFSFVALLFLFSMAINDNKMKRWTTIAPIIICFCAYITDVIINNSSQTFPYKLLSF